jgi:Protein of unknown function (DUF4238)
MPPKGSASRTLHTDQSDHGKWPEMPNYRSNPATIQPEGSQYHHFIPRFILRHFAHPYKPVAGSKRHRKVPRKDDPMLYTIDLAANGEVVESPVAKSFGLTDMYRDLQHMGNQHDLEKRLAKLECEVGQIIANIRKKHEAGDAQVWMIRKDRDTLRKFLFVMKYRGIRFHRRFQHQTAEEYSADDREVLLKYMAEKGFTRPIDVWFDNIKTILNLKMGPESNWMRELHSKMYPEDAMWAVSHIQDMYMALCTPSNQSDEFLLSENLFNIFEGPHDLWINRQTGLETQGSYTEFHVFAAITPRLTIVLRSNILPNLEEDQDEETKKEREMWYHTTRAMHTDPSRATSTLEDLPVRKANNSYTRVVGGKRQLLPGEDGSHRAHHKVWFPVLPHRHQIYQQNQPSRTRRSQPDYQNLFILQARCPKDSRMVSGCKSRAFRAILQDLQWTKRSKVSVSEEARIHRAAPWLQCQGEIHIPRSRT